MSTFRSFIVLTSITASLLLFIAIPWLKRHIESIKIGHSCLFLVSLSLFECPRELITAFFVFTTPFESSPLVFSCIFSSIWSSDVILCFFSPQIYDLQMDPWWFLIHSGCFLTSSASWFHAALHQMCFITQKSVLLLSAWWFPAWLFAVKNIFNYQFPPQSIRNMGLTSLKTIYDINIVVMQRQGMNLKLKLRPPGGGL